MITEVLIYGTLVSIVSGILSYFVVSRNVEFAGVGISHAAFGGVAIAMVLGVNPVWFLLLFTPLVGVLIASSPKNLSENTAIGILFPFFMSLGIILIYLSQQNLSLVWSYLFGNIFLVGRGDFLLFLVVGTLVVLYVLLFFRDLVFSSFSRELARAYGVNTTFINYSFMVVLSLGIVVSIKMLGIVLLSAFLVLPASISFLVARGVRRSFILTILFSVLMSIVGIQFSYWLDLPSGASIVVVGTAFYILFYLYRRASGKA